MSLCYDWSRPVSLAEASAVMYRYTTHSPSEGGSEMPQRCHFNDRVATSGSCTSSWANICLMTCSYRGLFAAAQETNKRVGQRWKSCTALWKCTGTVTFWPAVCCSDFQPLMCRAWKQFVDIFLASCRFRSPPKSTKMHSSRRRLCW